MLKIIKGFFIEGSILNSYYLLLIMHIFGFLFNSMDY